MVDVLNDDIRTLRRVRFDVTSESARLGLSVGITNTRLSAAKRGIAVELAVRLAVAAGSPVCILGADPTDRDVARRLPQLASGEGEYSRMHIQKGPHTLDVAFLPQHRLCVMSVSDWAGVEVVLPELREMFRFVIIDAPSRVGSGVGISGSLLGWLDVLLVASGFTAAELTDARLYLERLASTPSGRQVEVRVVASGDPHDSGLAWAQLERRLRALPTIGRIPKLWGRATNELATGRVDLDDAFRPIIDWLVEHRPEPTRTTEPGVWHAPPLREQLAARLYQDL